MLDLAWAQGCAILNDMDACVMRPIAAQVARKHGLTVAILRGRRRDRQAIRARREFCYRAHREGIGLAEIGRFVRRDRTTVNFYIQRYYESIGGINAVS